MSPKVKCICKNCGKEFYVYPSKIKCGGGKYCSRKCSGLAKTGKNNYKWKQKIQCICKYCGKEFYVIPSVAKNGGGKFCSVDCKGKFQSEHITGENNPSWKGGKVRCVCEVCGREFEVIPSLKEKGGGRFCSTKCMGKFQSEHWIGENSPSWKGRIIKNCEYCGKEFEVIISHDFRKFCSQECARKYKSKHLTGENNPSWKGGRTPNVKLYRNSDEYADWRTSCMARDDFTCQECGKKGGLLNVHHIKTVKDIFKEYGIKTQSDWKNCEELWDMNNGVTLCKKCHIKLHKDIKDDYDEI